MYHFNKDNFHVFEKRGNFFYFDIFNIASFEINELCYNILSSRSPFEKEEICAKYKSVYTFEDIESSIDALIEWEIVSEKEADPYPRAKVFNPFTYDNGLEWNIGNSVSLIISSDCNLRCKYCSADYGRFGQGNDRVQLMSKETAKKAIDFVSSNIPEDYDTTFTIIPAGGEPFLNFDVFKFIVEYSRQKNPSFDLVFSFNTNATLLNDEMAKWIAKNKLDIRFSIDGMKEIHDSNRIYPNGKGSYESTIIGQIYHYGLLYIIGLGKRVLVLQLEENTP